MQNRDTYIWRGLACLPALLLLTACVDPFEEVQDDGGVTPQPDLEVGCTEGQVRCLNQSYTFLDNIPYRIVGAGVSTCAPVID